MKHHGNRKIFQKLAHFNPNFKDKFGNQIIDYLVLDSLCSVGPLLNQNPTEIKKYLKSAFMVEFAEAEIIASGKRLFKKGMIDYREKQFKDDYPIFNILAETENKINKNICKTNEIEQQVFDEWAVELSKTYSQHPNLTPVIERLVHLLQLFLSKLLQRHGIECVSLIYPRNKETSTWFESLGSDVFGEILTGDDFTKAIFEVEVTAFFQSDNELRRHYVLSLLNSSYFWHLTQVDDDFSKIVGKITAGQKMFLDANILYSLVGLAGSNSLRSTNSLLGFAKQLNYSILVTTKTIEEFQYSVNNRLNRAQFRLPVPRDLAKIAAEQLHDDSLIALYWKEYAETNRSIEGFISEKLHIKSLLKECGITIFNKHREEIEASDELKDEESLLRSACGDHLNQHIVEHDAYHRVLINKLRQRPKFQFHNAKAWFLTQDRVIPPENSPVEK